MPPDKTAFCARFSGIKLTQSRAVSASMTDNSAMAGYISVVRLPYRYSAVLPQPYAIRQVKGSTEKIRIQTAAFLYFSARTDITRQNATAEMTTAGHSPRISSTEAKTGTERASISSVSESPESADEIARSKKDATRSPTINKTPMTPYIVFLCWDSFISVSVSRRACRMDAVGGKTCFAFSRPCCRFSYVNLSSQMRRRR